MDTKGAISTVRRWLTATLQRYVSSLDVQALVVLGGALLTVVAALAFIAVAGSVMEGDTQQIDEAIVQWFRQPGNPSLARGPAWLTEVAIDITALGSTVVLVMLVGAVAGFLWLQGQTRLMLLLIAAMAGGSILNALMKMTFAPGNRNFASVYPASESKKATLAGVIVATTMPLTNHRT